MSRLYRSLRLVAALLAAVGLLARPARAVVVCPMETSVVAETAAADEHAHHTEGTPSDAPSEAPEHEICPDLAHCAVAAPVATHEMGKAALRVVAQRVLTAQDRPTSAVSSLEPPPPKQR